MPSTRSARFAAPLATDEVVHTHRQFQNDIAGPRGRWALAIPCSRNSRPMPATAIRLCSGPGTTGSRHAPTRRGPAVRSISRWDNINDVFLKTQLEHDARGNLTAQTRRAARRRGSNTRRSTTPIPRRSSRRPTTRGLADAGMRLRPAIRQQGGGARCQRLYAYRGPGWLWPRSLPPGAGAGGCKQRDENRVTAHVTGTQAFGQAAVLTLESLDYLNDGEGGLYAQRDVLQSFPDGGRLDTVWQRHYVDGLGRVASPRRKVARARRYRRIDHLCPFAASLQAAACRSSRRT